MTVDDRALTGSGVEYLVDVYGCDPDLLRSCERLNTIVTRLVSEVGVRPIRGPLWQMFPEPGGITALWLLAESHLAVHTYPETRFAAISLYCCGSKRTCAWESQLRAWFEADHVDVRTVDRGTLHPSGRYAIGSAAVDNADPGGVEARRLPTPGTTARDLDYEPPADLHSHSEGRGHIHADTD